ncbi:SLATT domain-containing protein [Lentzea tibetensis]|uniref:SLATT domain-containing protein n=1 Tax=Lentzea tibetensis TaxID=2591470 RepID=UPI001F40310C|nr:SLATT domain-containing protein [Lentzea tibetensis]
MSDLPTGLTPLELAKLVLTRIEDANGYAKVRKQRFRWKSVAVRVSVLVMTAASTIILGLQNLNPWTGTAFSLVAIATVVGALEPFFAWRSLWVLMEEAAYRFYRLHDELEYYLASVPPDELDARRIREVFDEYQGIWDRLSNRWLQYREISDR